MKKLILPAIVIVSLLATVGTAFAVKPSTNLAGAQKVDWNLSADVMPVPPYGSGDILGSDTASKLIVNQPNGNTEVAITGAMNGLNPNTTYTVYLSNGYTPYVETEWNVAGSYVVNVEYLGVNYLENMVLTQDGTDITGTSLGGGPYPMFTIISGSIIENNIHVVMTLGGLTTELTGTIATDGSMSGTWRDIVGGSRAGTWATTSGHAVKTHTGSTGWPGLFTSTVPTFTFTTDEFGAGSWHVNLRDEDFSGAGDYTLSVWINRGGTILISDTFKVVVD